MRKVEYFNESEIPYGILAKFGLTREMIESLPEAVMDRLLSSRATPVLPLVTENDGVRVCCQGRISLTRNDDRVDVIFNPEWQINELEDFTPDEQEQLNNGDVLYANVNDRGKCFVQLDSILNKCMFVPAFVIDQNIDCLASCETVDDNDIMRLKNGQVVEITEGNDMVTVGIDLDVPTCIRIVKGDTMKWWKEREADNLPQYSFGLYGCWINDGNDHLTYVDEDDYTNEMLEQQALMAGRNAATAQMNNIGNTLRR